MKMLSLLLTLSTISVLAQTPAATVTTQNQTVATTAPVIPAGTNICTPQKNGVCKTTTAIFLKPLQATVLGQASPVVFSPTIPLVLTCENIPVVNGVADLSKPVKCTLTVTP